MSPASLQPAPAPSLLRRRPFALFWSARVATALAFQMQAVAVGWQAYALTGSAFYLGLVGLAQFLPMFLLTLAVGQVVDRYDRRRVAGVCQFVEGLAAAVLAVGSAGEWLSRESLLAIVFVVGASRAFEGPSLQALVPALVPGAL
ncbi:MAG TPA: MFS transporter, partial [Burkholderiales bacterium]|nr:MFS transporter [Burkholderiales bacterium]